jgi:hypothetical protein
MEPQQPYPTDLSDNEWALIQPYVPEAKRGGRPAEYPKGEILNGIFYPLRMGYSSRIRVHPDLGYPGPPPKGGHSHGKFMIHRYAGPLHGGA